MEYDSLGHSDELPRPTEEELEPLREAVTSFDLARLFLDAFPADQLSSPTVIHFLDRLCADLLLSARQKTTLRGRAAAAAGAGGGAGGGDTVALPETTYRDFEQNLAHASFHKELEHMRRFVDGFWQQTKEENHEHVDELALADKAQQLHDFMHQITFAIGAKSQGQTRDDYLPECVERWLMLRLGAQIFEALTDADEDTRLFIQIGKLQSQAPHELHLEEILEGPHWLAPQQELRRLNEFDTPGLKLLCLTRCSQLIMESLAVLKKTKALGADDFLPAFIYTVLKANPPRLHTNIKFIDMFRDPSNRAGQAGYVFVSLCTAVEFLRGLDAARLALPPPAAGNSDLQPVPETLAVSFAAQSSAASSILAASANHPLPSLPSPFDDSDQTPPPAPTAAAAASAAAAADMSPSLVAASAPFEPDDSGRTADGAHRASPVAAAQHSDGSSSSSSSSPNDFVSASQTVSVVDFASSDSLDVAAAAATTTSSSSIDAESSLTDRPTLAVVRESEGGDRWWPERPAAGSVVVSSSFPAAAAAAVVVPSSIARDDVSLPDAPDAMDLSSASPPAPEVVSSEPCPTPVSGRRRSLEDLTSAVASADVADAVTDVRSSSGRCVRSDDEHEQQQQEPPHAQQTGPRKHSRRSTPSESDGAPPPPSPQLLASGCASLGALPPGAREMETRRLEFGQPTAPTPSPDGSPPLSAFAPDSDADLVESEPLLPPAAVAASTALVPAAAADALTLSPSASSPQQQQPQLQQQRLLLPLLEQPLRAVSAAWEAFGRSVRSVGSGGGDKAGHAFSRLTPKGLDTNPLAYDAVVMIEEEKLAEAHMQHRHREDRQHAATDEATAGHHHHPLPPARAEAMIELGAKGRPAAERGQQQQQRRLEQDGHEMRFELRSQAERLSLLTFILFVAITAQSGSFDARIRTAMKRVLRQLGLSVRDLQLVEERLAKGLMESADLTTVSPKTDTADKWWIPKVLLGAAVGGAALAVTGGLAAPLVGAMLGLLKLGGLVTALTTATGISGATISATLFGVTGATITADKVKTRTAGIKEFLLHKAPGTKPEGLRSLICVPGWFASSHADSNGHSPWAQMAGDEASGGFDGFYTLVWESDMLRRLGKNIESFQPKILPQSLAIAVLWPQAVLSNHIDDPWSVTRNRASKAGVLLAEILMQGSLGARPITLVGFSNGARLIFTCLEELARLSKEFVAAGSVGRDPCGIVENVVLIGTPIPANYTRWETAKSVVAGRLVNCYCPSDSILHVLYRSASGEIMDSFVDGNFACAGTTPVLSLFRSSSPGCFVENVDVSSLVRSHLDYHDPLVLRQIMRHVNIESTQAAKHGLFSDHAMM